MGIRRAGPGDARALAVLRVRTWQEAYPGQIAQAYLDGLDDHVEEQAERWRITLETTPPPDLYVAVGQPADGLAGWILVSAERAEPTSAVVGEVQAIYTRQMEWGSRQGCVADGASKVAEFGGTAVNEMRYRVPLTGT